MYTDALDHLAGKGLTAAIIVGNFHWRRVLPLTERKLPLFKLMQEAPSEGSRMMTELLSHEIATQRAVRTVAPLRPASEIFGESRCALRRGTFN